MGYTHGSVATREEFWVMRRLCRAIALQCAKTYLEAMQKIPKLARCTTCLRIKKKTLSASENENVHELVRGCKHCKKIASPSYSR